MKSILSNKFFVVVLLVTLIACGGGSGGDGSGSGGGEASLLRSRQDFVNLVVNGIFVDLNQKAVDLETAINSLRASVTQSNLDSAKSAWIATRVPWEQSEAALFGPADIYGLDPAMDTWPLSQSELDAVLGSGASFSDSFIATLNDSLKGFHAIEYILFGDANSRTAAQLTARELDFASALARNLKFNTQLLLDGWLTGIQGEPAFADVFLNAGQAGNTTFPTEQVAVEQIVRGMIAICAEVGEGKIQDPFSARDPNQVESQYSFNTLADFADNIRGVGLVFDRSLRSLTNSVNPGLSDKITNQVDTAVNAILAIPSPFSSAIQSSANDGTIRNAQERIADLQQTLEVELLPLVVTAN